MSNSEIRVGPEMTTVQTGGLRQQWVEEQQAEIERLGRVIAKLLAALPVASTALYQSFCCGCGAEKYTHSPCLPDCIVSEAAEIARQYVDDDEEVSDE